MKHDHIRLSALLAQDQQASWLHTRHLLALRTVCEHWRPLSVHALAALIDATPSTTSRTADRLVAEGLLTRTDNPDDRRVALLEPTQAGRDLNARIARYLLATDPPREAAA